MLSIITGDVSFYQPPNMIGDEGVKNDSKLFEAQESITSVCQQTTLEQ